MKLAVPTCIAVAPAIRNSMASFAEQIPPNPITGIFTLYTCHTIRRATGFMAGPDNPPVIVESTGFLIPHQWPFPITYW